MAPPSRSLLDTPRTLAKNKPRDGTRSNELEWKRHPSLYMEDGTVVILANTTVFRTYIGLLSRHSEVFRGMASLSEHQPAVQECYDGCPLIRLTDNEQDVAFFLGAVMCLPYVFHVDRPTSFRCASGILRMATKYMVAPLRQEAIAHFARTIAVKFDQIENRERESQVFGPAPNLPHPFELLTLFRECHVGRFLPLTLYTVACEHFDDLCNGTASNGLGEPIRLSEEDRRLALLGNRKLTRDAMELVRKTIKVVTPNCECVDKDTLCMEWLDMAFRSPNRSPLSRWRHFKLLEDRPKITLFRKLSLRTVSVPGMRMPCSACRISWLKVEAEGRANAWNNLPKTLELLPWSDLYHDSSEDMTSQNNVNASVMSGI